MGRGRGEKGGREGRRVEEIGMHEMSAEHDLNLYNTKHKLLSWQLRLFKISILDLPNAQAHNNK